MNLIQKLRYEAMTIYLKKNNWLTFDENTGLFNIAKHKEVFDKIENLDFEEAINSVRVYEKKILGME